MMPAGRAAQSKSGHRWFVLWILIIVFTFNFIDRQIVGILAVPIKADLALSDTQLGLMGGLAFAIFYTLLGIPIARLADRASRIGIMTAALALWSLMTAACGIAQCFGQLFLCRLGVGVGEAGGVAPAYSLICDYFPRHARGRALAVYSFGIPIGSALGILAGGFITRWLSWRMAFFIVGLAGLLLTPLLKLAVPEPIRGRYDPPAGGRPATLSDVFGVLGHKPSFWLLSLGAASASMMGYGLFFWMPSFMVRSFGMSLVQASLAFGALLLFGGLAGIWLGGSLVDRYGDRNKAIYAWVPAAAFVLAVPLYVAGVLTKTPWVSLPVLLLPVALGLAWLGPVLAAIQHLVPSDMRATASAIFLFVNNLIGIGLGTTLIGALSDAMRAHFGAESLRYAILTGTGFYAVAVTFLLLAARKLPHDWQE